MPQRGLSSVVLVTVALVVAASFLALGLTTAAYWEIGFGVVTLGVVVHLARPRHEPPSRLPTERVLATVVFTDIVESTQRAASLGDRRWRRVLDRHDAVTRNVLARFRGSEIRHTGDGFLATFDSPARAVHCASATMASLRPIGVQLRVGVHTGEVEVRDDGIDGIAVHIGARVCDCAEPDEILVSQTVKDATVGSELQFVDRGTHELKGVPERWQLYAARI